ncbi:FadR/GntR family transcriptional regulator [Telmatospirillum siberiense]|nr:FadR/GntR family transcriptional regulator [Telmatospirillum siberiense]
MAKYPHLLAPLVPTASRPSQVVEMLSADIRAGIYQPKDRLPTEQELIARFAVSRTVIREALASLKAEGLIVTRQGSGAFVAENPFGPPFRITPDEMHSIPQMLYLMQLRLAVEVEAAGIAAENRTARTLERMGNCLVRIDDDLRTGTSVGQGDYEFHLSVAAATGNPYFERFIRFLRSTLRPGREINPALKDPVVWLDYFSQIQKQHRQIHAAIESQDPDGARDAARAHLEGALNEYRKMADYPPFSGQPQTSS